MASIATLSKGTWTPSRARGHSVDYVKGKSIVHLTRLHSCVSATGIQRGLRFIVDYLFMLCIKGCIGPQVLTLFKGLIGMGWPAMLLAPACETFVAFLPGARNDLRAAAFYTPPYPLVTFLTIPTAALIMRVHGAWMPMNASLRRRPRQVSAVMSVELLPALTSAPSITARACIPVERRRGGLRPTVSPVGAIKGRRTCAVRPLRGPSSSPPCEEMETSCTKLAGGGGTATLRRPRRPPCAARAHRWPVTRTLFMHSVLTVK